MSDLIAAITLHQPFASLIAVGAKPYETRSWRAPASLIGQRVAIHAGKNRTEGADLIEELFEPWEDEPDPTFVALCVAGIGSPDDLPYGAVVCTAVLSRCVPTETVSLLEQDFGDLTPGRWAWRLDGVVEEAGAVLAAIDRSLLRGPGEL